MSLSEETLALRRAAHDLMYLGMDGNPVYSDDLSRRNGEVYRLTRAIVPRSLITVKSRSISRKSWIVVGIFLMLFLLRY